MNPLQVALFGECMIELQGAPFGTLTQTFGGDTLNTAVYLSRCAAPGAMQVHYATALGDDAFSEGMLQRWQHEGLSTALVRRLPGRLPGLYAIHTDARGERSFSYWRDSSAARSYFVAPETPLEHAAPGLDALYFSGISLAILDEPGRERLFGVAKAVRARGGQVVFDNNYRPRLWPDVQVARRAFAAAMSAADIVLLTLDDEQALYGDADAQLALERALQAPCAEVVVKRGAAPALVRVRGGDTVEVPVPPVPRLVDTTAAGDSFAAGYLVARLAGHGAAASAAAGHRLAGRVVQHAGAVIPREAMGDLMPLAVPQAAV